MAFPTTILRFPALGLAGMIADASPAEVVTGVVSTANILAGVAVSWFATDADKLVRVGIAEVPVTPNFLVGGAFKGIAILDTTLENSGTANNPYLVNQPISILRSGCIWVAVAGATVPTDPVTFTIATGVIGNTAPAAGFPRIPARWESSTTGAGIARLRLYCP